MVQICTIGLGPGKPSPTSPAWCHRNGTSRTTLALSLPQNGFFSDILPLSSFMPQGLIPQDINHTLLGSSHGRSDTCKRFLTTIYTETTSPNIDIDFWAWVGDGWFKSTPQTKAETVSAGNTNDVARRPGTAFRRPRHPAGLVVAVLHRGGTNSFPRCFPWPMSCLTLWVVRKMKVVVGFHAS